jgi:hypothetical protein
LSWVNRANVTGMNVTEGTMRLAFGR